VRRDWILFLSLILSFLTQIAFSTGGAAGDFLLEAGSSARALSMGKAFTALEGDGGGVFWNPASLATVPRRELSFLYSEFWEGTNYQFLNYTQPTLTSGTFGLSLANVLSGNIEGRDEYNQLTGKNLLARETMAIVTYSRSLTPKIRAGLNIRYLERVLGESKDGFGTMDLGGIIAFEKVKIGLKIQNLGELKNGTSNDRLLLHWRVGLLWLPFGEHLITTADLDISRSIRWYTGAEWSVLKSPSFQLLLRLGAERKAFSLGIGLRSQTDSFTPRLDYAFFAHKLGFLHRVSLSLQIGKSYPKVRTAKAQRYLSQAKKAYREGAYFQARTQLLKAKVFDETLMPLYQKLDRIIKALNFTYDGEIEEQELGELIKKSISLYLEDEIEKGINILHYVLSRAPHNEIANKVLKVILLDAQAKIKKDYWEKPEINIVDKKLWLALKHFYEGKYPLVIKVCQDVLSLEPKNVLALMRLGSAYYMMGNLKKAQEAWQEALKLEPENEELKRFLELKKIKKGEK
jgi:tetratricopeptide (TPR) repeat protein